MTIEGMPSVGSFTSTWGLWNIGANIEGLSRSNCLSYIPIVSTLVPFFYKSEPQPQNLSLSAKVGRVVRDLVAMVPIAGNLVVFIADLITSAVRSIFAGLSGENFEEASDLREAAASLEAFQEAKGQEVDAAGVGADLAAEERRSSAAAPIPREISPKSEKMWSTVRDTNGNRIEPAAYHPS